MSAASVTIDATAFRAVRIPAQATAGGASETAGGKGRGRELISALGYAGRGPSRAAGSAASVRWLSCSLPGCC